jgi:glycosyltransferase involved in cell wall biosynthesis
MADPALDLSKPDGGRFHVERLLYRLRAAGHEIQFVSIQAEDVVLIDTGYGLQQFFEATRYEPETRQTGVPRPTVLLSEELVRLADKRSFPENELRISDLAYCAARRAFRDCDLIHTTLSPADVGGLLAAGSLQKPLVVEVKAPPPLPEKQAESGESQSAFARFAVQETLRAAAVIVSGSPLLRDLLVSRWNVEPGRVAILPHAVEAPPPTPEDRVKDLRIGYGLGFGPVLAFFGALEPCSALEVLIGAFEKVVVEHPSAKLLVVGDGPERERLEKQVSSLDLNASVRFTGPLTPELGSELINIAEIAVAPRASSCAGRYFSSIELVEWMAAGKAIVCSRTGDHLAEILREGETALLVEPGSLEELSSALGRLFRDVDLRRRLGQRARDAVERNHSWTNHISRLTTIYGNVLDSRAPDGSNCRSRSA